MLTVECQESNDKCYGRTGVGKSFATIMVKIGSGKNYHWMLILGGNSDDDLCMTLKCLPNRLFINCKGEKSQ